MLAVLRRGRDQVKSLILQSKQLGAEESNAIGGQLPSVDSLIGRQLHRQAAA